MVNFLIAAPLCWLLVQASSHDDYEKASSGWCDNGPSTPAECLKAIRYLGYEGVVPSFFDSFMASGCIIEDTANPKFYYNMKLNAVECNNIHKCVCYGPRGKPVSKPKCEDIGKKKICKTLSWCNWNSQGSPRCTSTGEMDSIPLDDFCEAIHVRGYCKRYDECMWLGNQCVLREDASCRAITKRRICSPLRSTGCLNGRHCFWTGSSCLTNTFEFC